MQSILVRVREAFQTEGERWQQEQQQQQQQNSVKILARTERVFQEQESPSGAAGAQRLLEEPQRSSKAVLRGTGKKRLYQRLSAGPR